MSLFSAAAQWVLGDYQIYRIYMTDVRRTVARPQADIAMERLAQVAQLRASPHPEIRSLAQYGRSEAVCLVARQAGEIAAACWFWSGEAYKARNFWPLASGEAKLIQITTAEPYRARGIATSLLVYATSTMLGGGYSRLYARVWHSNRASTRAFEQAGWRQIALVVELQPLRIGKNAGSSSPRG